ncbi:MAG: hypothetical protein R1F54_04915 [Candidatus Zeuxoniibacter abyssi]|nr:MAG: hypothetical protein R1F54_04915 [Candidatus Persebacteraceae bacterium AB1(2)]
MRVKNFLVRVKNFLNSRIGCNPALSGFCERRGCAPVSIATIGRIIADDKDKTPLCV